MLSCLGGGRVPASTINLVLSAIRALFFKGHAVKGLAVTHARTHARTR